MRGNALAFLLLIGLVAVQTGCSDNGQPVSPDPVTPATVSFSDTNNRYLWGLYKISIDPSALDAEIIPQRIAEGHLNALRFLEVTPCATCLTITDLIQTGPKTYKVNIQLRHPFVGLDQFTGFNVRGICMFDSTYAFSASGYTFPNPDNQSGGALLNAEGYTHMFNPTDFPPGSQTWAAWEYQQGKWASSEFPDSLLNPFLLYGVDNPRRYYGCTQAETRTFEVRFAEDGPLVFGYAVDACWDVPLVSPPDVPDDFPISANCPEAYKVVFVTHENTLWIEDGVGGGGHIRFHLKVYDHQNAQLETDGGTVKSFRWEIDGMTNWQAITPVNSWPATDSTGPHMCYEFFQAPVPDESGLHNCLITVIDTAIGITGQNERAWLIQKIPVQSSEACWSPGEMIADTPSENYEAHLNNAHCTYVDSDGLFHLFYLDPSWLIHHLVYEYGVLSDDIILEDETAFNLNAVPDSTGAVHLVYSDDPEDRGGYIVYRKIEPDGEVGEAVMLSEDSHSEQFLSTLAVAPDDTIFAAWMDSQSCSARKLHAAWFDGFDWTDEMTLATSNMPSSWVNPSTVADSSNNFHILYNNDPESNLYYIRFDHGMVSIPEALVVGSWNSVAPITSIGPDDWIYTTFQDDRTGSSRGWLIMRDPVSGEWSLEKDMVGYNHANNRYQNIVLPDSRLAAVWTDHRDTTRGLYSKVFFPFLSEDEIQGLTDEEIDSLYQEDKFQTRLCIDEGGTLHLVWSDYRSGHWQLYYSTCTP